MSHTLAATAAAMIGVHAVCGAAAAQPIPRYRIEVVATLQPDPPLGYTAPYGATTDGSVVVGIVDRPGGIRNAFVWRDGVLQDLPTLPGRTMTFATGINSVGTIVGSAGHFTPFNSTPILWSGDQISVLPILGGGTSGHAEAINDLGQIVGSSVLGPEGPWRPTLWQDGQPIDLGVFPGYSGGMALDISNSGQILGYCSGGAPGVRPTIWSNGSVTALPLPEESQLANLGGINDAGKAVGVTMSAITGNHAVLWSGGAVIELAGLGSGPDAWNYASDINNHDDIIGGSNGLTGFIPTLWRHGVPYDLREFINPLDGVDIIGVGRITDDGVILATASMDDLHASVRLVPVPAPGTLAGVAGPGLLALARSRRRR